MTDEQFNQAIAILKGEGVENISHIALRRFAKANGITEPFELAQAWIEHL